jgi:arginine repressor
MCGVQVLQLALRQGVNILAAHLSRKINKTQLFVVRLSDVKNIHYSLRFLKKVAPVQSQISLLLSRIGLWRLYAFIII